MPKKFKVKSIVNKGGIDRIYIDNNMIIDVPHEANISCKTKLSIDLYENEDDLPKETYLLILRGIVFRSFEDKSLFSAGGLLAQIPKKYKMNQELCIVLN